MTSKSGSRIENPAVLLFSIFYIVVGIAEVGYFVIENFAAPPHIPILGVLSLLTAYALFKMKKWALPLVVGLFFVGITFGATTLLNSITLQTFGSAILFHMTLTAYMIILLVVSVYIVTKRESFS